MKRLVIILGLVLLFVYAASPVTTAAQQSITITQDHIVSYFPDKLVFQLSANSNAKIQNISLLYRTNGATCQSAVAQQVIDFTPALNVDTQWEWDFTLSGVLPPGAMVYWQWEVSDASGNTVLTEEQSYQVNDTRHTWNLLTSGQVNLQWYQGSSTFGQSLLSIAVKSLDRMANNAGVRPSGQIWITIYPTAAELLEVDIHASEWAGGVAYPEYNSTIIAIGSGELDWAASVIPHELAHLVTQAVVFNCQGMWLPTWLSEGLAVYAEGDISSYYSDMVTSALDDNKLPPLRTLESGFSSISEEANLSYGQSGMVVTYLIAQYGAEKMSELLAAVQSGKKIDKALMTVYGKDTDGIEADWRISLGYAAQPTLPPVNSTHTAVPTMALWTSAVKPSSTPTTQLTLTPAPVNPTATTEPPSSSTPITTPNIPSKSDPASSSTIKSIYTLGLAIITIILIAAAVIILIIVAKRRKTSS